MARVMNNFQLEKNVCSPFQFYQLEPHFRVRNFIDKQAMRARHHLSLTKGDWKKGDDKNKEKELVQRE